MRALQPKEAVLQHRVGPGSDVREDTCEKLAASHPRTPVERPHQGGWRGEPVLHGIGECGDGGELARGRGGHVEDRLLGTHAWWPRMPGHPQVEVSDPVDGHAGRRHHAPRSVDCDVNLLDLFRSPLRTKGAQHGRAPQGRGLGMEDSAPGPLVPGGQTRVGHEHPAMERGEVAPAYETSQLVRVQARLLELPPRDHALLRSRHPPPLHRSIVPKLPDACAQPVHNADGGRFESPGDPNLPPSRVERQARSSGKSSSRHSPGATAAPSAASSFSRPRSSTRRILPLIVFGSS